MDTPSGLEDVKSPEDVKVSLSDRMAGMLSSSDNKNDISGEIHK
jgi:hypothetical protein